MKKSCRAFLYFAAVCVVIEVIVVIGYGAQKGWFTSESSENKCEQEGACINGQNETDSTNSSSSAPESESRLERLGKYFKNLRRRLPGYSETDETSSDETGTTEPPPNRVKMAIEANRAIIASLQTQVQENRAAFDEFKNAASVSKAKINEVQMNIVSKAIEGLKSKPHLPDIEEIESGGPPLMERSADEVINNSMVTEAICNSIKYFNLQNCLKNVYKSYYSFHMLSDYNVFVYRSLML